MSAIAAPAIRTVTFGAPQAGLWGGAWASTEGFLAVASTGSSEASLRGAASLEGSSPNEEWRLAGSGAELTITPQSEPVLLSELGGFDQACRIRGTLTAAGAAREIETVARRTSYDIPPRFASIREVSAFFADDDVIALTALRPRDVPGHDQDLIVSSLFDCGQVVEIADPRFSTTYAADGHPARASLELWLAEDDEGGQYPRRAVAAAIGGDPIVHSDGLALEAIGMQWHSRGRDGIGVYTLTQL